MDGIDLIIILYSAVAVLAGSVYLLRFLKKKFEARAIPRRLKLEAEQNARLTELLDGLPDSAETIFQSLSNWPEGIRYRAMDLLAARTGEETLPNWVAHYKTYRKLPRQHFLTFLLRVFDAQQSEILLPYKANPEIQAWFARREVTLPKTNAGGEISVDPMDREGQISGL